MVSVLLAAGLLLALVSLFAPALGLDQDAGWGRARIGVLLFGLAVALFAAAVCWCEEHVRAAARRLQARVDDIRIISGLRKSAQAAAVLSWVHETRATLTIGILVLLFYLWFASGGTWTRLASSSHHYSSLAAGFEAGQLHLLEGPEAGQRAPRDVSLFDGKYYLYWGPVPALMLLPLRLLGVGLVPDSYLALAFIAGTFIVQCALLSAIWSRYFAGLPRWTLNMAMLVAGMAGPALFLRHNYESAKIYEAAINGGQFFLLAGLLAVLPGRPGTRRSTWSMLLGGVMWAFALGTRLTLVMPIGVMTAFVVVGRLRRNHLPLVEVAGRLWIVLPLVLGIAGLGWYNWARFGSPTETGQYYQLGTVDMTKHYDARFDPAFIPTNAYNYVLHAAQVSRVFPFVRMVRGIEKPILPGTVLPKVYHAQPVAGLLWISPFAVVFSGYPVLVFLRHRFGRCPADRMGLRSIILLLYASFLTSFCLVLTYFWVGLRFLEDFLPSLTAISAIGFWIAGGEARRPGQRWLWMVGSLSLAGLSMLLSTLLALSTYAAILR